MGDYAPTEAMPQAAMASPLDSFFPPEKERVDAPEPAEPKHEFEVEDRRHTDWPRRRAIVIDSLLLGGTFRLLEGAFKGYIGAAVFTLALGLTYFFVAEATTGRTIGKRLTGLRVVMRDGRPAPANAVAGRTVLRLLDFMPGAWIVGGLTMLLTGGRRQRLGDLATGTIVRRDDRPLPKPPHSPLLGVYPILWIGMALLIMWQLNLGGFHAQVEGRVSSNPYMQKVDETCQRRVDREVQASAAGQESAIAGLRVAQLGYLDSLTGAPASARHDVGIVKHEVRGFLRQFGRAQSRAVDTSNPKEYARLLAGLMRRVDRMGKRLRQVGLPHCAAGMRLSSRH
jgi:uncharacterized RDD family membrane protein YckC